MEAETDNRVEPCPLSASRLPALITVFLLLCCCFRGFVAPVAPPRSAGELSWETLRSLAPATLTVQLVPTPFPHLEGKDNQDKVVWRAFQSSETVSDIIGWGGPICVGIVVDQAFRIKHLRILQHNETPSFFAGIEEPWFQNQFIDKDPSSPLEPGIDIDGLSQATVSVTALCQTVRETLQRAAHESPPSSAATPAASTRNLSIKRHLCLFFAMLAIVIFGRRYPRTNAFLIVILIGLISPQFISFAHINVLRRLFLGDSSLLSQSAVLLSAFVVLHFLGPRGYCRFLCPAGALQTLLYCSKPSAGISSGIPPYTLPIEETSCPSAYFRAASLGRIILWAGLLLFLFAPDFPLHQLEVFSALFFRNQGVGGWLLVSAFILGSSMTPRWYCLALCPLNHFFTDLETVVHRRRHSAGVQGDDSLKEPLESTKA